MALHCDGRSPGRQRVGHARGLRLECAAPANLVGCEAAFPRPAELRRRYTRQHETRQRPSPHPFGDGAEQARLPKSTESTRGPRVSMRALQLTAVAVNRPSTRPRRVDGSGGCRGSMTRRGPSGQLLAATLPGASGFLPRKRAAHGRGGDWSSLSEVRTDALRVSRRMGVFSRPSEQGTSVFGAHGSDTQGAAWSGLTRVVPRAGADIGEDSVAAEARRWLGAVRGSAETSTARGVIDGGVLCRGDPAWWRHPGPA